MKKRFEKFFIKSEDESCWLWLGTKMTTGYGQFRLSPPKRATVGAHRMSWELYHGPIPDGMYVLHKCDVRACVRPDHLFLGSQKDNVHDMISKGRYNGGPQSTVGIKCVYFRSDRNNWIATSSRPNRKHLYQGNDFFEACCARKSWETRHKIMKAA